MMESEARGALCGLFDRLGIEPGQAIMVHSDMSGIPLPRIEPPLTRDGLKRHREQLCRFVYETLRQRLGPAGTLAVPAFSYSTTAAGNAFHLETTPSEVGPFPEYVRLQPDASRSLHPIFSIAATGRLASVLTIDTGPAAFGHCSPWQRFSEHDMRIITLGTSFRESATYVHHLEQCFGSPHRFNKVLHTPVYQGGNRVPGPWLSYLRYRSVDLDIDLTRLEDALRKDAVLAETEWNSRTSSAVSVKDIDRIGYEMLIADPWAFANRRVLMDIEEIVPAQGPCADPQATFELKLKQPGPTSR